MQNKTNDSLSWDAFYQGTLKRKVYPPKTTNLFNRLVAHTKNFFAISGIGAFIPGYLLVMTKELKPSFGMVKKEDINEMNWFIKILSSSLVKTYKNNENWTKRKCLSCGKTFDSWGIGNRLCKGCK